MGPTLFVNDVSTPAAQVRQGGTGRSGLHADLAGGLSFGSTMPPIAPFSISLNADAAATFLALAHTGGFLTLGLSLPGA